MAVTEKAALKGLTGGFLLAAGLVMAIAEKVELRKGLRGVFLDRSETSFIDGKEGKLLYRGYNIHDLAEHSTFEETCYLLLYGKLPTSSQLDQLDSQLKESRGLSDEVLEVIRLTKSAHPMDVLRTAVSAMSSSDPDAENTSEEAVLNKGIRLTAAVATIVAAHDRIRNGKEPVAPDKNLNHAANFMYMLRGEAPDDFEARLVDKDLVLHVEHGTNASAFTSRVAASTRADVYAAITAAISTLKGPLHGGAAEGVMKMAHEIGDIENVDRYVNETIAEGRPVMGFGHPVYRAVDPRSVHLKADAQALGERKGTPGWFTILEAVTQTKAMTQRARKGVLPNVDFWSGAVYYLLEIPEDLFIPVFAIGRMPGWVAHLMEQYASKGIIRPLLDYSGPMDLEYLPIEQRG